MIENQINIEDTIEETIHEFHDQFNKSAYDINDGLCSEFAEVIIDKLGGYRENLFELDGHMFLNEFSEIGNLWERNDLIRVENSYDSVWSRSMLDLYGYPPIMLERIQWIPTHIWIFYDEKHYDAESPKGEFSPWCLKIFNRYFKHLMTNS